MVPQILEDFQGCMDMGRRSEHFQMVRDSRLFQATSICSDQSGRSSQSGREITSMEALRHCNTMDSPYIPSYGRGGAQPADDISNLDLHASMENLRELQKYSEKLQFEATCCRLWAEGIRDQIMDEQDRVQTWITGMTDELIRLKRIRPAWIHQLQTSGGPPAPLTSIGSTSIQQHQPASSSAASTITVKPAPMSRNLPQHLRRGMHRFQKEKALIHGLRQR